MPTRHPITRLLTTLAAAASLVAATACHETTAPDQRVYTLEVAPERVACNGGVMNMQCLQVRESTNAPFTLFYDTIQGFAYEPGYQYLIRVRQTRIANPPADASSSTYVLVSVISKTLARTE